MKYYAFMVYPNSHTDPVRSHTSKCSSQNFFDPYVIRFGVYTVNTVKLG